MPTYLQWNLPRTGRRGVYHFYLWRLDTRFLSANLYKGGYFCGFLLAFLQTNPFWKRIYSKRNEFAPKIRVDPFSEGRQNNFFIFSSEIRVSILYRLVSVQTIGNKWKAFLKTDVKILSPVVALHLGKYTVGFNTWLSQSVDKRFPRHSMYPQYFHAFNCWLHMFDKTISCQKARQRLAIMTGHWKTLWKHAYSSILKIPPPKTESFQIKILICFSYFCSKT